MSDSKDPLFSVVTPSFNMLPYLMRCHHSVADQGEPHEHIVMDAVSKDGTPEWLRSQSSLVAVVEPDRGMYDAVNKGLRRARGRILSYLNCDEQYLPGTLTTVRRFFDEHPRVDVVFGNTLLIEPSGKLLAFRKGFKPRWPYIVAGHLYVLSCTMFFRRRIVDDGVLFDTEWRDIGDSEFVVRLLRAGYRAAHVPRFFSAFTMTGANMSAGHNARAEEARALMRAPRWVRAFRAPLNAARLAEKTLRGAYRQRMPIEYSVYPAAEAGERRLFTARDVGFRWPAT